jgi:hypothetical protein
MGKMKNGILGSGFNPNGEDCKSIGKSYKLISGASNSTCKLVNISKQGNLNT